MGVPCGWTVERCGCTGAGKCWDKHSPATRAQAAALAAHLMWAATGRRYGPCEVTVMPCNPAPPPPLYPGGYDLWGDGMRPVLQGGVWSNQCGGGCSCQARCEVELPGPIASIVEVTVDGEPVPLSAVEVHDGHVLVRVDGSCWPNCQTFGVELPTFTVAYRRGLEIPAAVQAAVEVLACQYATACSGGACALPPRLASLSRQGVSVTMAAVDAAGGKLRTGIQTVDDVIDADNPWGLTQAPMVLSPDYPPARSRVVTWAGGS